MPIINIGQIDKKLIIPIFGGLIKLLSKKIFYMNPNYEIIIQNPLIISICYYLGMILTFIPYLIFLNQSKKKKNQDKSVNKDKRNKSQFEIKYEYYDIDKKLKINKYKLLFISSMFDFLETLIMDTFCNYCLYNLWILNNIFISLFSFFILKTKLYKHQYFSKIVIVILGILLNIIEYKTNQIIDFSEIFAKLVGEFLFCISIVINKYNMEKNYCTPYEICFWEGIINIILCIICLIIFNLIGIKIIKNEYPKNIIEYYNKFNISDSLIILSLIISGFVYNLFIYTTCDYYNPNYTLILVIIHELYPFLDFNKDVILNIICILILLFILFMVLVFIEIIELNFWGLSKFTKKNIGIRADSEINIDTNENTFDNTSDIIIGEEEKKQELLFDV